MSLPDFTATGDLPVGVHKASLTETVSRFGTGSHRRKLLAIRLERIYQIAAQTGYLARFVVFGSFITEKYEPNDVDVFMIMDDNFDMGSLAAKLSFCSITERPKIILDVVYSGFAAWRPSVVKKPPSKIGNSNAMALNVASSKSRGDDHDCKRSRTRRHPWTNRAFPTSNSPSTHYRNPS